MTKLMGAGMAGAAALAALAWISLSPQGTPAEAAVAIPAPARDVPAATDDQTAVFAGGCFWGVEAVFQHVEGVTGAVSGYAGGSAAEAHYETVGRGRTGHAEAVRVTYDPSRVSYGRLLQIFFSVAHDPTQLNRQGPDTGPQYRSAIFPRDAEQRAAAEAYIAQLNSSGRFARPLATRIEDGRFYRAEDYHQNFMSRNPRHPYIVAHDAPKLADLRRMFANDYSARPAG
ncbi:MAG: peptide-methionine (S)-S-oxide reductase MsrA [Sphingomonadaceae bacterium]|nr:peptide-methionine (S)-S-oxide reductase MsrA [Sphingomonadaceae bacterium]